MNYTVRWVPKAEQELASVWLNASDRDAVTQAAHRIEQRLRSHPESQGESRDQGRRILLEAPLGVLFRIEPQDMTVYVLTVWSF